jgi:hypothetical protein
MFGTTPATSLTVISDTLITATSPAEAAGTVDITVIAPGGTSPTSPADQYIYGFPAPTVTAVNPTRGPLAGGVTVDIAGTNFIGATAVMFGTIAAQSFMVISDTLIAAASPAEAAGTVDITVTGPGGTSITSSADQYTYVPAPTVTAVNPTSGLVAGGTIVAIAGTGLTGATAVMFGTTPATTYIVSSATSILAVSPAEAAGTVDITVTTPGGTSANSPADRYTYGVPAPTVTAVNPTSGTFAGGTKVAITGTNFTGATVVRFGTATASFAVLNATSIIATSPAGSVGTVDITVTTPGGTSSTSPADRYTYFVPAPTVPTVTAVNPTSGPGGGGTTVTITGTNFTGATAVRFGNANAASFTVNSATSITATSPAGSAGTVDITVTTPGGASSTSPADQYVYLAAFTVPALSVWGLAILAIMLMGAASRFLAKPRTAA